MRPVRALEAGLLAIGCLAPADAQTGTPLRSSVIVKPADPAAAEPPGSGVTEDQLLQLEVFVNERPLQVLVPFTLRPDGSLATSAEVLEGVGIKVPPQQAASEVEIALDALPGVAHRYDEGAQAIHFTLAPDAQRPTRVGAGTIAPPRPEPVRPPFGALVNYTLFASADAGSDGLRFGGLSGAFESRLFGRFGLVENGFLGRTGASGGVIRLGTTYSYEDPRRLITYIAGDTVSGGFSWTRPIRMGGIQLRRSFGLRPDLVTVAVPTLGGTAAAPSTLDLYINKVRTLSADVPRGPYEVAHPPIVYGSGQARLVLRDVLGRETVSTTAFYASPDLLAPGLTDFSVELGFARRNYAILSSDYDGRLLFSASWRRGLSPRLTLLGHAEATRGLVSLGGGAVFTLGSLALASVAMSGSRAGGRSGALVDIGVESHLPGFSVLLRTLRTFGDYEDLASWTAAAPAELHGDRRIYGQPREVDQASLSLPLWRGASAGASYVQVRRADDVRSRIGSLSFTQDFGRFAFFASAARDFGVEGLTSLFAGLSIPLGGGVSASLGATRNDGRLSGYVEATRQGAQEPGAFGWEARASEGQRTEAQAILRYSSRFARFEAGGLYSDGAGQGTFLMEGAVSWVGGALHVTHRLDEAFALVDVGAPGVAVLRENRPAGSTGRSGKLLVTGLAPFVANRIAIDPAGLPVDVRVEATEAVVTPFSRVPARVDFGVRGGGGSALVLLVDPEGRRLELGSAAIFEDGTEEFVVGYDGETYVDGLRADNRLIVSTPDGATCRAHVPFRAVPGEQARIGPIVCRPET